MLVHMLILYAVCTDFDEVFNQYGCHTLESRVEAKLRMNGYGAFHLVYDRWPNGGRLGQTAGFTCNFCGSVHCRRIPTGKMPPETEAKPVTQTCRFPTFSQKMPWNDVKKTLFGCLCDPEKSLDVNTLEDFLIAWDQEMGNAIDINEERVPNLDQIGRLYVRQCLVKLITSTPFRMPRQEMCVELGSEELLDPEGKVIRWLTLMDLPSKKRLIELETMPCFLEAIGGALRLVLNYYSTLQIDPPVTLREFRHITYVTLKRDFGPLKAGEELIVEVKEIKWSRQLVSAVLDLIDITKEPNYIGYVVKGERMYIYTAVSAETNRIVTTVERTETHTPGGEWKHAYGGIIPISKEVGPFGFTEYDCPESLDANLSCAKNKKEQEKRYSEEEDGWYQLVMELRPVTDLERKRSYRVKFNREFDPNHDPAKWTLEVDPGVGWDHDFWDEKQPIYRPYYGQDSPRYNGVKDPPPSSRYRREGEHLFSLNRKFHD
jgi:hypothetical protein